jgi:DNA repair protein SbcD/Mre11
MKFAHISDSHLGAWRQPELQRLNTESFKKAIEVCINEEVDFILFTGDLFDSPFPPVEILKETFAEFRKLKEAGIKSYIIAGSHDYSVSGKTFLDVLEKAGFCEICKYEENSEEIILKPLVHKSFYIYGYPGKKSGLEVNDLKRIRIEESYADYFRILMLHTTIREVTENLPVDSIKLEDLPKADYYALGHVHIDFEKEINGKPAVYGGPTFPNNFKELEEIRHGSFYIVNVEGYTKIIKKEIRLKDVEFIEIKIEDALQGTGKILNELEKRDLLDKIVLLRVYGILKKGKASDIKFQEIQEYLEKAGAYSFLKNSSKLESEKNELDFQLQTGDMDRVEESLVESYKRENPSDFNKHIFLLLESLNSEKQEGETSSVFETRLLSQMEKILSLELI